MLPLDHPLGKAAITVAITEAGMRLPVSVGFGPHCGNQNLPPLRWKLAIRARHWLIMSGNPSALPLNPANRGEAPLSSCLNSLASFAIAGCASRLASVQDEASCRCLS